MKKYMFFAAGFLSALVVAAFVGTAFAAGLLTPINVSFDPIKTQINGKEYVPPEDMTPFIYNGRTFVSVRFIGELFGKDVDWDQNTRTVIINDPPKPAVSYFENDFVNTPLSEKWTKSGSWTFDGVNGLRCDEGNNGILALTGIPLSGVDKYTLTFDALGTGRIIAGFSFGKDDEGEYTNFMHMGPDSFFAATDRNSYYGTFRLMNDSQKIVANINLEINNWYAIKIVVDNANKIAHFYADGSLIVSQAFNDVATPIFAFTSSYYDPYYIKNFTFTLNE